ncbi:MAG: hypothetical protein JW720_11130 [Sedimentisphaerales bacterium]|nr:hypothetical protein [Sedimentisphaerales bacterium]
MNDPPKGPTGFDFYDIAGVAIPGAALLFGVSLITPRLQILFASKEFGIGNLGLFLVIAYVAGQFAQVFGNILEILWWLPWGGKPTSWILGHHKRARISRRIKTIISDEQIHSLINCIPFKLNVDGPIDILSMDKHNWYPLTRQIHSAVAAAGRAERVEKFSALYGLNRGMCVALFVLSLVVLIQDPRLWFWSVLSVAGAIAYLFRMHRFGKTYAQELFVQFLQLPVNNSTNTIKSRSKT